MMSTTQAKIMLPTAEKLMQASRKNEKTIDIVNGAIVALGASQLPFFVSLGLARVNGLTGYNYPAIQPMAAMAGFAVCLLALPIAYELTRRSVHTIVATTSILFWILGLLTSFTMQ